MGFDGHCCCGRCGRLGKESEIPKGVLAKGNPSEIEENTGRLVRQILQKLRVVLP